MLGEELHIKNAKIDDFETDISLLNDKIAEFKHNLEKQKGKFEDADQEKVNLINQNS